MSEERKRIGKDGLGLGNIVSVAKSLFQTGDSRFLTKETLENDPIPELEVKTLDVAPTESVVSQSSRDDDIQSAAHEEAAVTSPYMPKPIRRVKKRPREVNFALQLVNIKPKPQPTHSLAEEFGGGGYTNRSRIEGALRSRRGSRKSSRANLDSRRSSRGKFDSSRSSRSKVAPISGAGSRRNIH